MLVQSKVINTINNIIGIVIVTAGKKAWVHELNGGDLIFEIDNLQIIESVSVRPHKITSDRNHTTLFINQRPVFTSLEEVVKERVDAINEFLL